ncbi:MAG TPA: hypothetical protein EYN22_06275 [Nitrospinaceae bacterium]|jgi:hypothetical protein|nr:hypothetical protein [Nitrospinaceae bacterium]
MVTPKPYEKRILNGKEIVVVFKPEGIAYAKEKYPKVSFYSIREIEAFEGLEVLEQKMLQQAKQIFGGAIFTEENFYKYYPKRNKEHYGSKSRV